MNAIGFRSGTASRRVRRVAVRSGFLTVRLDPIRQVPCVIALPLTQAKPAYANWVRHATG
jgi:uncharacterized protein involved in tolerance to divalent cations